MSHSMSPALRRIAAAAALSLSLVALPCLGQQAGDAAAGATKAATCTACHGLNGNSANPEWPSIAGQNAAYAREQIAAIRSGKRPNPLMQPLVQGLTDQDIADLAVHYSQQTPSGREADPSYWKAGQKLYRGGDAARGIPACMACHGPVGRGNPAAAYPAVQAQYAVYTVKQLENYAIDARYAKDANGKTQSNANAQMMNLIASRLSAEDRRNLASYIQGIR
jgi:cytochrome c553